MSFERSYSIESHERIKLILVFGDKSLLLTWWVLFMYCLRKQTAVGLLSRPTDGSAPASHRRFPVPCLIGPCWCDPVSLTPLNFAQNYVRKTNDHCVRQLLIGICYPM